MTGAEIVVLVAVVVLIGACVIVFGSTALLIWSVKKLAPEEENLNRLMLLDTKVANLESQVVQLRTKKAGRASAQRKADMRAEPEGDPRLAGLSPEDRALFTTFGDLGDLEEES